MIDGYWRDDAACRHHDPGLWFPGPLDPGVEAKQICQTCPVQQQCLDYARRTQQNHGIWGGVNVSIRTGRRTGRPPCPESRKD